MWGTTECGAVSSLLWNYTAHRLSEGEIERVERHLAHCGACRAEADSYRATVDALASIRRTPVPESRRGWHELYARLSAPEQPRAASRNRPIFPVFAWGSAVCAAGALCFLFFSRPATVPSSGVRNSPALAELGRGAMPERTASAVSPYSDVASRGQLTNAEIADALAAADSGDNSAPSQSVSHPHIRRVLRRPVQLADARPAVHSYAVAGKIKRRSRPTSDAHLDGRGASGAGDQSDYVLTPVSATSESDAGAEYVMGSVMMTARSSDTEVASGW